MDTSSFISRNSKISKNRFLAFGKLVGASGNEEKANVNLSAREASGTRRAFRTVWT